MTNIICFINVYSIIIVLDLLFSIKNEYQLNSMPPNRALLKEKIKMLSAR